MGRGREVEASPIGYEDDTGIKISQVERIHNDTYLGTIAKVEISHPVSLLPQRSSLQPF